MSKARLTTASPSRFGLQARLTLDRLFERDRGGRVLRHQLAELVDLPVRHLQDAADVAQHAARLQCAEGDDLRHLVAPVTFLHIADNLVAALLTEVDIEVRHRHALGIEEALEQQAETNWIEVGDCQRIGDKRARARTAAGTNGYALFLRPLDEVGDDQEVTGIFHPRDHADLEIKPFPVFVDRMAGGHASGLQAPLKPVFRALAQFARLVERFAVFADREARQDRLVRPRSKRAALRDLDRRGECLGQVGKQFDHLRAAFEAVFGGQLPPVTFRQQPPFGDADQRILRFVILHSREIGFVGGHQRHAPGIREIDQYRLAAPFGGRAVALQLDIKPVAKQLDQRVEAGAGEVTLSGGNRVVERTAGAAGQRDDAICFAIQPPDLEPWRLV